MAFRKRNVAIAQPGIQSSQIPIPEKVAPIPGIRPSPLDGRPTTSTGIRSLDSILAGHAGLALGTSLLLEESGTTDFGGTLLKYYAAEGVLQGHHIHVLGMHQGWGRELPGMGVAEGSSSKKDAESKAADDKMKIAWRYERLGEFGASGARGGWPFVYMFDRVVEEYNIELQKLMLLFVCREKYRAIEYRFFWTTFNILSRLRS